MDASSALRLYRILQRDGITLMVDGPDLVIEPFSVISERGREMIRQAKPYLIDFVQHPPETWLAERERLCPLTPELAQLVKPEWFTRPVAVHLLTDEECAALARYSLVSGRPYEVEATPVEYLPPWPEEEKAA